MKKANRGPAASAANRLALMRSARKLFAAQGLDIPFSAIAKDAGVSQGVLYRHFSSRADLALAVFEENLDRIERAVANRKEDESGFNVCWRELVEVTVADVAFIQTAVQAQTDPRMLVVKKRIEDLVVPLVEEARESGSLGQEVTSETVFLALRAIYGVVSTTKSEDGPSVEEVYYLAGSLGLPVPG